MSKKRKISHHNLEHIILNEIKQMDSDFFESVVEYIYGHCIKVTKNKEEETYEAESTNGMDIEELFGEEYTKLLDNDEA